MFRTRVIYLWLYMVVAAGLLVLAAAAVSLALALLFDNRADVGDLVLVALLPFPLALVGCLVAIVGSFPMMALMQRLLIATGTRCGRPTGFPEFRRALIWHSLVPAALPALLAPLALLLPPAHQLDWPLVALLLTAWALATVGVWRWQARRLHAEWQAGVAY